MIKNSIFAKIYTEVAQIPKGKVATYGQIARLVDIYDARIVGWALHSNTSGKIPCHRVVNKHGMLAENYAFGGWRKQKQKLLKEGVTFSSQKRVDLQKHRWEMIE